VTHKGEESSGESDQNQLKSPTVGSDLRTHRGLDGGSLGDATLPV
jgi:hypothetical protein